MLTFIVRRMLALPLVMLAVTLLIVALLQLLSPAQRASAFIDNEQQARNIERVIKDKGLDQPFVVQYWTWLRGALQGNLGFSQASNQSVRDTIAERFPATLELVLFAVPVILGLGVWLGTLAGLTKDRLPDQILRVASVVGYNVPTFVLGIVLLVFFYGGLGILPGAGQVSVSNSIALITGEVPRRTGMLTVDALLAGQWAVLLDALRYLILPTITLATISFASTLKITRSSMLETLGQDYVRTARSKGLPERVVNLKHARRNALLPVATFAGFTVIGLLEGAVITETIFARPGIGRWGAEAAARLDYAGVLGFALVTALIVVVGYLVVDVVYGLIDPRVRFD